jgi:hypothetical protein
VRDIIVYYPIDTSPGCTNPITKMLPLLLHYSSAFITSQQLPFNPSSTHYQTISIPALPQNEPIINSSPQFTEKELIEIAQDYTSSPSPSALSPEFIFRGPVIGPLNKSDFVDTLTSISSYDKMGLKDAFPDLESNAFGFTIDPIEKNRVWYFERPRGTFIGSFDHPVVGRIEPTGAEYIGPPEARSVIIDFDGLIKYQSVGYVVDRFTGDTTGGQGAVFGMYKVMGQDMDDSVGSWKMVFLQWLSSKLPEGTVPKSFSKKEDLPRWWTDERMGSQR